MRRLLLIFILCVTAYAGGVPPFTTTFMRTVLDDSDAATARATLEIGSHNFSPIYLVERSSNPTKPSEGYMVIWMSDGTGFGDDGDLMVAATAGGVTNYGTLWDHSGGTTWNENVVYNGENVVYNAEQVVSDL